MESFLPEAGAHVLSARRKNYGRAALEILGHGIEAILSTEVNARELIGRIILMFAYDDVSPFAHSGEHIEHFLDSKPINLSSNSTTLTANYFRTSILPSAKLS